MTRQSQQLKTLKAKQAELKARIQLLEATEKSRERKRETRRKILVGAYILERAREEGRLHEITAKMNDYLIVKPIANFLI